MTFRRLAIGLLVVLVLAAGIFGAWEWRSRNDAPERSTTALCERLSETVGLDLAIATLDPTRLGPLVAALERSVQVAPDDIVQPLTTLTSMVREVTDEVRAEPTDKKQALANALAARQDRIDAVTEAGVAVEQWSRTNCEMGLRSTTSTTSRTTTTKR